MRPMISRHNCGDDLLAAIGSIAVESAYLERWVETMLYRLTKLTREMGHPIIEGPMLGGKLDLLLQVAKVKLKKRPKKLAQFSQIVSDIKHVNSERATAIHGVWLPDITNYLLYFSGTMPAPPAVATKRGKIDKPDTALRADQAAQVAARISELHHDLHEFARATWPPLFRLKH